MSKTSIEQSKRLLELGLNPESADMYYIRNWGEYYARFNEDNYIGDKVCPCWSLGALLKLLPYKFVETDKSKFSKEFVNYNSIAGDFEATFRIEFDRKEDGYRVNYSSTYCDNYGYDDNETIPSYVERKPTLFEAVYELIVWLLENEYKIN